jgi:Flp pilus assembly protein TadB
MGGMRRRNADNPTLITTAPESNDDEYDRRRKRYAVMMGLRALCVIGAAATYRVSIILAMVFVVGGLVLPWCAVLIANDRPPKKRRAATGYVGPAPERALPAGESDRTVDG